MERSRRERFLEAFRERMAELVEQYDSCADMAREIGVSKNLIRHYMNGTGIPNLYTASIIAEHCEVSLDWLIGKE